MASFAELYTNWRERLEKLTDAELETVISHYMEFENGGRCSVETNDDWREKWIEFILDTDPIMTDDGLAGFMEMYVPK